MRLEEQFNELFKQEFLSDTKQKSEVPDFFISAVNAAKVSTKETRTKIIGDMAEALGCNSEDLSFLFEDTIPLNDNYKQTVLPSFRQTITSGKVIFEETELLEAAE